MTRTTISSRETTTTGTKQRALGRRSRPTYNITHRPSTAMTRARPAAASGQQVDRSQSNGTPGGMRPSCQQPAGSGGDTSFHFNAGQQKQTPASSATAVRPSGPGSSIQAGPGGPAAGRGQSTGRPDADLAASSILYIAFNQQQLVKSDRALTALGPAPAHGPQGYSRAGREYTGVRAQAATATIARQRGPGRPPLVLCAATIHSRPRPPQTRRPATSGRISNLPHTCAYCCGTMPVGGSQSSG